MRYVITPYAYRKIRETIKISQTIIKQVESMKDTSMLNSTCRVTIKLTVIKQ